LNVRTTGTNRARTIDRAPHLAKNLYRSEMRFGYAACEYSLINPLTTAQ
jgi:hypothetical protein